MAMDSAGRFVVALKGDPRVCVSFASSPSRTGLRACFGSLRFQKARQSSPLCRKEMGEAMSERPRIYMPLVGNDDWPVFVARWTPPKTEITTYVL